MYINIYTEVLRSTMFIFCFIYFVYTKSFVLYFYSIFIFWTPTLATAVTTTTQHEEIYVSTSRRVCHSENKHRRKVSWQQCIFLLSQQHFDDETAANYYRVCGLWCGISCRCYEPVIAGLCREGDMDAATEVWHVRRTPRRTPRAQLLFFFQKVLPDICRIQIFLRIFPGVGGQTFSPPT